MLLAIAAAVSLTAVSGTAAANAELPNFTFRDAVAGALTTPQQFGACDRLETLAISHVRPDEIVETGNALGRDGA